jgi:hypothetical protein
VTAWTQGALDLRDGQALAGNGVGRVDIGKPIASRSPGYGRRLPKLIANASHTIAAADMIAVVTPAPSPPTPGRNAGRVLAAVILGAAGLGLAAIGAVATVTYSLETTGRLMAALAAAADAVALILPAAACALWTVRRRLLAAVAWCLWMAATGITAANVAGFIGQHTDSFLSGREVASTERTLVLERLGRLRTERAKISETRPIGAITVAIQNSTRGDLEALRTNLALAKRRDVIDGELAGLETRVATLPAVSAIDPSASVLAEILRLPSEIDLRRIRLAILLLLPLTSGLLIAMALAIGARTEPSIARDGSLDTLAVSR